MAVLEDLSDEERYLLAILNDESGVDIAEFCWQDADGKNSEGKTDWLWRAWTYQYNWYRCDEKRQIDECFPAGSLVLTSRGHVPIEEVRVGDEVLTHEGRWKPVTNVFDRGEQDFVRLKGYGHPGLITTPDHEFYTRRYRRRRKVELAEPMWTHARDVMLGDEEHDRWASPAEVSSIPLPSIPHRYAPGRSNDLREEHLDDVYFWWLVGLYCAEGSVSSSYGKGGKVNRVTFSVHVDELDLVGQHLELLGFHYATATNGSVVNVVVNSLTFAQYLVELGGKGASSKRLHPSILGLNRKTRNAVFDGMQFGDGHFREDRYEYSTVSRALAFDMRLLSLSLGMHSNVSEHHRASTCIIQGRTVNQRPKYCVTSSYPKTKKRTTFDGHLAWSRIHGPEAAGRGRAYDLEVADDHSYIVEGIVAHNCARAIGKSVGIQLRAFAFPFTNPGNEMLLTAPELIHLDPVTKYVEDRLLSVRLSREMLKKSGQSNGINKRPFEVKFTNGAKILGRIPQKDGRGVKGMHPRRLEIDEGQDYPEAGWVELMETLKYGDETSSWRIHGVSRGVRDRYYKLCQPESGFYVHRVTALHRPDWTDAERKAKAEYYGSKNHPDYRRNILGKHGDSTSPLFVLSRLMQCVSPENSDFSTDFYYNVAIREEQLKDSGMPIESFIDIPGSHLDGRYTAFWGGMDVGMTQAPTEILIFGEEEFRRPKTQDTVPRLCLVTRVHLERISALDQRRVMRYLDDIYNCKIFAMDRTGVGLPIYQDAVAEGSHLAESIRGYNFSEKILVGWDKGGMPEEDAYGELDPTDNAIMANVLEFSSDHLRLLVDQQRIMLPWDIEVIREFQGQNYVIVKSNTNPYGKKEFNKGTCHALDAARMAILGFQQAEIEPLVKQRNDTGEVLLQFLTEADFF